MPLNTVNYSTVTDQSDCLNSRDIIVVSKIITDIISQPNISMLMTHFQVSRLGPMDFWTK